MAKAKSSTAVPCGMSAADSRRYEVDDALRTLTRAEEIKADKSLIADVQKAAAARATDMQKIAGGKTGALMKRGLISDKAAARMKARG